MRKTLNLQTWMQYLCWKIQFWMMTHRPRYPRAFQNWAFRRYGYQVGSSWKVDFPWWLPHPTEGPFLATWERIRMWFRQRTGGRSQRCEFTDKEMGALYGHAQGPFMDSFFEEFLHRIDE
jgi:hypothetical protein